MHREQMMQGDTETKQWSLGPEEGPGTCLSLPALRGTNLVLGPLGPQTVKLHIFVKPSSPRHCVTGALANEYPPQGHLLEDRKTWDTSVLGRVDYRCPVDVTARKPGLLTSTAHPCV